jgi:hypothetical protein
METPTPFVDIMVTYEKKVTFGIYGTESKTEIITKRGFYSPLFDNVAIPPSYQKFNGRLLPHGWGGDHIKLDQVIKWEYCKD